MRWRVPAQPVKVLAALSGGVDSSVAAALLVQQGYQVIGMMMRLWSESGCEDDNRCCSPEDMNLARQAAAQIGIPFYVVNAQQQHRDIVVQSFLDGYTQGVTPNPCLTCNRHFRWVFLLSQADAFGAAFIATGHYARLLPQNGRIELHRGLDPLKDQSYVLHGLSQAQLARTLLPLGDLTKPEVRQLARQFGLPTAERADSQDLCFLSGTDYRPFLLRHAPQTANPGPILTTDGRTLGQHQGLAFYTIGQRKGLGFSAPVPYYVIAKDPARNALIVGPLEQLGADALRLAAVHWIAGSAPSEPFRAQVKIRYTAAPAWGRVTPQADSQAEVHFDQPLRDITPGQSAVIYQDDLCLGGGLIQPWPPIPASLLQRSIA